MHFGNGTVYGHDSSCGAIARSVDVSVICDPCATLDKNEPPYFFSEDGCSYSLLMLTSLACTKNDVKCGGGFPPSPSPPSPASSKKSGSKAGVIVGVVITLLVVGGIVGFIVYRKGMPKVALPFGKSTSYNPLSINAAADEDFEEDSEMEDA